MEDDFIKDDSDADESVDLQIEELYEKHKEERVATLNASALRTAGIFRPSTPNHNGSSRNTTPRDSTSTSSHPDHATLTSSLLADRVTYVSHNPVLNVPRPFTSGFSGSPSESLQNYMGREYAQYSKRNSNNDVGSNQAANYKTYKSTVGERPQTTPAPARPVSARPANGYKGDERNISSNFTYKLNRWSQKIAEANELSQKLGLEKTYSILQSSKESNNPQIQVQVVHKNNRQVISLRSFYRDFDSLVLLARSRGLISESNNSREIAQNVKKGKTDQKELAGSGGRMRNAQKPGAGSIPRTTKSTNFLPSLVHSVSLSTVHQSTVATPEKPYLKSSV